MVKDSAAKELLKGLVLVRDVYNHPHKEGQMGELLYMIPETKEIISYGYCELHSFDISLDYFIRMIGDYIREFEPDQIPY